MMMRKVHAYKGVSNSPNLLSIMLMEELVKDERNGHSP